MSNVLLALEITALGMGLVFAAIILLWWMMAVLTHVFKDKDASPAVFGENAQDKAATIPVMESDVKARAAAIAVAVALAEQKTKPAYALSTPPAAIVSAWQLGMRTRRLTEKGTPIVRSPRKVG